MVESGKPSIWLSTTRLVLSRQDFRKIIRFLFLPMKWARMDSSVTLALGWDGSTSIVGIVDHATKTMCGRGVETPTLSPLR